ncbi:MAG: 3-deoxy-manno-octulosonate cytidylyltransferase [Deltaproteobacteria bacterium]|nr:3-deoxy-manno-octulosonate cytidylyltransferase [Deltaproteobacteria bacterium]
MRCCVVIPARHGSTRFPGKPLALLAGRPLICHVVERATAARVGPVVVATDDERIVAVAAAAGARVALTRADCRSGTDRVAEAVSAIPLAELAADDAVINVQGDEPRVEVAAIRAVVAELSRPGIEMATAAAPLDAALAESPHVVKVAIDGAGRALYFSRAAIPWSDAAVPLPRWRHLGLYGYRRRTLLRLAALPPAPAEQSERLEQLRALHHGIPIAVVHVAAPWRGVDTPADLAELELASADPALVGEWTTEPSP